jgi:1-acyl-sn-glycerol-3-phosphate acyltransferase
VVYLCNHRSWADFFCDQVITGGASYLARLMVWIGTPVSSLYAWMSHSTWFFNRKRGIDRAAFAKFMDTEWARRSSFGMIAYPEGTRNQDKDPLPLKTGVLQFAFEYKRPVQCVITAGKENVVNEKRMSARRDQTLITECSVVLDPAKFDSQEKFVAEVRKVFAETWKSAYTTRPEDAVVYEPPLEVPAPGFASACEPAKLKTLRIGAALVACVALAYPQVARRFYD